MPCGDWPSPTAHAAKAVLPSGRDVVMFSVYATHADVDDPLSALRIGEQPEPHVLEGWTRVKVSHASLNRHDLFTLRGITAHPEGIPFPIIMGND